MRIIKRKTLSDFWAKQADAKQALLAWHAEAQNASWKSPDEIVKSYPYADPIADNRIVFNIK